MSERKHIWITGASGGIGSALADALAPSHTLTLTTHRECDVTDAKQVASVVESAVQTSGPIDVLIHCAGVGLWKNLTDLTEQEFSEQIDTNLKGSFIAYQAALKSMLPRKSGLILTVSSIAAITAYPGNAAYGATKSGGLSMTRVLRNEVRRDGIKVTDIILGATATAMWDKDEIQRSGDRMMTPQDVYPVVEFLISQMSNPRSHYEEIVLRPQLGDL